MKSLRICFVALLAVLSIFSLSVLTATRIPLPPPPVLCGCICPDGSFITTHAPTGEDCPQACATACNNIFF